MSKIDQSNKVIDLVRAKSNGVLLFNSLGKDSLVTLDLIYPKFERIVCVFMYFVPGLEHIERYINWCKIKYPRIEFVQVPHWNLTRILKCGIYCVPNPEIRILSLRDINESLQLRYGINDSFYGMKKADSLNRRLMLDTYENYIHNGNCYPLADWTQKEILSYMKLRKLPHPVRYSKKASGGVGFDLNCYLWMRKYFPRDLEKVLKVFPMSEKILFDYDNKIKSDGHIQ